MMASLNHSSSPSSSCSTLISDCKFKSLSSSRQAPKEQSRVLLRIDAQPHAAPLDHVPFAGNQVFDRANALACIRRPDENISEMQPELMLRLGQCDRHRDRIVARYRLLHEADDLCVIDLRKAEIAGLQERGVALS